MSNYQDVTTGEPWKPEPAARYNAVNQLLRGNVAFSGMGTAGFTAGVRIRVLLPGGNYVTGKGYGYGIYTPPATFARDAYCVANRTSSNLKEDWGILISQSNSYGMLLISGLAVIPFELITETGRGGGSIGLSNGEFVRLDPGEAKAEILAIGADGYLVNLLPDALSEVYKGEFAISGTAGAGYTVSAGNTDIPGNSTVPAATLPAGYTGGVYLSAPYDAETQTYSVSVGALPSPAPVLYVLLGSIDAAGNITQTYRGTGIRFGRDYFL